MNKYTTFVLALGLVATAGCGVAVAQETTAEANVSAEVSVTAKPTPIKDRLEAAKLKAEATKAKVQERAEAVKAKIETRKEDLADRKASTSAAIKDRKEERKAKLEEAKKNRIETIARKTIKTLENALERVREYAVRVEARVTKMEANAGVDLSAAKAKLLEGRTAWDAAKAKVVTLEADLKVALDSETPIAAFETFKTHAAEARDGVKTAHAKVVEAVRIVAASAKPAAAAEVSVTATTSVSAETNQ